jgi:hypothetical protein
MRISAPNIENRPLEKEDVFDFWVRRRALKASGNRGMSVAEKFRVFQAAGDGAA